MCRIIECPKYVQRTVQGIKEPCSNCEYIKKEKEILYRWKIALIVSFVTYVVSTYIIFN